MAEKLWNTWKKKESWPALQLHWNSHDNFCFLTWHHLLLFLLFCAKTPSSKKKKVYFRYKNLNANVNASLFVLFFLFLWWQLFFASESLLSDFQSSDLFSVALIHLKYQSLILMLTLNKQGFMCVFNSRINRRFRRSTYLQLLIECVSLKAVNVV